MSECNAIIEANNEINRLKRENKKLNALCVQYGFDMGRLGEENEKLKNEIKMLKSTIARNEAYITRLTKKGKWTK